MDSLPGCSSVIGTECPSMFSWGTARPTSRTSSIQSVSAIGQPTIHLQGLETIYRAVQTISAKECPYYNLQNEAFLGEGETFQVERCSLDGQLVAVKHLKLGSWAANTPKFFARLKAVLLELRIMCYVHLKAHPNILSLLGYGWRREQHAILPYIVVDYSQHGTLRDYLANQTEIPMYQKKRLVMDVANGLDALHLSGIVHGDIKLDNVLVFDRCGDPNGGRLGKICDFGHSLLLTGEEDDLIYRGTTPYNAPEVQQQRASPIERSLLSRCDVWSFGLLAWEVLLGGEFYMKYVPKDDSYYDTDYLVPQLRSRQLLNSALRFAGDISHSIPRLYFQGIFRKTLQYKPRARTQFLSAKLPPPHPPLDIGRSDWSFEMFNPERQREYTWEHQQRIAESLKRYYEKHERDQLLSASAAWQIGLCYYSGFGVVVDQANAQSYIQIAKKSGHRVAQMFHPIMQDLSVRHATLYAGAIIQALSTKNYSRRGVPVSVSMSNSEQFTFRNYIELRTWVYALAQINWNSLRLPNLHVRGPTILSLADLQACTLMVQDSSTGERINLVECAIFFRDTDLIELACHQRDLASWTAANESTVPLLVQACGTGNVLLVKLLLSMGADPNKATSDGCTMFHWLFMLGEAALDVARISLKNCDPRESIDQPCTRVRRIDAQWPLRLAGTPMAFAVCAGSVAGVEALLHLGAKPSAPIYSQEQDNTQRSTGWTPLHLAAQYHQYEVMKLLLAAIPDVDLVLPQLLDGHIPIGCALSYSSQVERMAMHGQFTSLALSNTVALLEPLSPLSHSVIEYSSLARAIDFNDYAVVSTLLEHSPHLANDVLKDSEQSNSYTHPVHLAVQVAIRTDALNSLSILELLLQYSGDNLLIFDSDGRSPLHISVAGYSDRVAYWLLHRTTDLLDIADNFGRVPLHYCASVVNTELVLSRGTCVDRADAHGMTSLHRAAAAGNAHVMQALVGSNADVNAQDETDSTPLHYAVSNGSWEAVKMLLCFEPDLNRQDRHGNTPLHLAVQRQREDVVRSLIARGASSSIQNKKGHTPLHTAILCRNSNPQHLLILNVLGVSSIQDHDGNTPIHLCSYSGRTDWLSAILSTCDGQSARICNTLGQSPLHVAATILNVEVAQCLVQQGVDLELKDADGDTAFSIALTTPNGHCSRKADFCAALCVGGACITTKDVHGQTPWEYAIQQQSQSLMLILLKFGGHDACPGLAYSDALLQAALGEKDPTLVTTYYDVKKNSVNLVKKTHLDKHRVKAASLPKVLASEFDYSDKEVRIDVNAQALHHDPVEPGQPKEEQPSTGYSDNRISLAPDADSISQSTESVISRMSKVLRYTGKGLGYAGLAVLSIPLSPILIPWFLRRRQLQRKFSDGDMFEMAEADSGGVFELPSFNEKPLLDKALVGPPCPGKHEDSANFMPELEGSTVPANLSSRYLLDWYVHSNDEEVVDADLLQYFKSGLTVGAVVYRDITLPPVVEII